MAQQERAGGGAHRTILFPVQDNELCERAFAWAIDNELKPGDAVHLLHVIVGPSGEDLRLDYFNQEETSETLAAQQPMLDRRFTRQLRERGLALPVTIHIVQASEDAGTLSRVICRHAEQLQAALVVVARPDRSWLHNLLMGSAADKVAKSCTRPVKLLRPADLPSGA